MTRKRRHRSRRCVLIYSHLIPPFTVRASSQTNGIFELRVKNAEGKEAIWTIDMKTSGTVYKGEAKSKPNVTLLMSDETFQQLAEGKVRIACQLLSVNILKAAFTVE